MEKLGSVIVLCYLFINIFIIVETKPFLNNGPLSFSIVSQPKEMTPETHITKIPNKSAKLQEQTTTSEPTEPPPSIVQHKINKVFQKILTISQLANTLRASSAEQVEEEKISENENENGYTSEDQTNPPPSFVEQKIGRIVQKLFTLSQFATNIRERFNQPNYIFEYVPENGGNETQEFTPDFDSFLEGQKDAEEIETSEDRRDPAELDERKVANQPDFEGVEALKEKPQSAENSEEDESSEQGADLNSTKKDSKNSKPFSTINGGRFNEKEAVTPRPSSDTLKPRKPMKKNEKELIEEEAYRVYLFNKAQLSKSAKNIDVSKNDRNLLEEAEKPSNSPGFKNTSQSDGSSDIAEASTGVPFNSAGVPQNSTGLPQDSEGIPQNSTDTNPKDEEFGMKNAKTESSIKVNFPSSDNEIDPDKDKNSDKNEKGSVLTSLKQTAEMVGYFVLEFFASFVGLTLGAVTQINHAFHQSNNTILVGIYNSTH